MSGIIIDLLKLNQILQEILEKKKKKVFIKSIHQVIYDFD